METISEKLNKTDEEILEAERHHYFIDYFSVERAAWYRNPWIPADEVKPWLSDIMRSKDYRSLRIWRESDLSTVVTYEGEEMTLRELFFGSMYQDVQGVHLSRHFNGECRLLDM